MYLSLLGFTMRKVDHNLMKKVIDSLVNTVVAKRSEYFLYRGMIINTAIEIERQLDIVIAHYLNKQKPSKIFELLELNLLSFGSKVRFFESTNMYKTKLLKKKYRNLLSDLKFVQKYRNTFAHEEMEHFGLLKEKNLLKPIKGKTVIETRKTTDRFYSVLFKLVDLNLELGNIKKNPYIKIKDIYKLGLGKDKSNPKIK